MHETYPLHHRINGVALRWGVGRLHTTWLSSCILIKRGILTLCLYRLLYHLAICCFPQLTGAYYNPALQYNSGQAFYFYFHLL